MEQKPKIFFTDLDDTLLDSQKRISPENAHAIALALKQGHKVVISTGRPLTGALSQIRELNLEQEGCYAITYNGGLIYDCFLRQTIYKKTLPLSWVEHIFGEARNHGLHCQTYDSSRLLTFEDSPYLQYYISRIHMPCRIDPLCPSNLIEEPVKVLVIGDKDQKKLEKYRSHITPWAQGKLELFYSNSMYLEHVALGISKGKAVQQLCRLLNIPPSHCVAAGDAENDIPMLLAAGIGAAMSNASPQVKQVADYITTKDCNHSGVAEILYKFVL